MEKEKISSMQMGMLAYPAIVATAILSTPGITAQFAFQDVWLSPIWASLVGIITLIIVMKLAKLFPQQTFLGICEKVVGKSLGKLLGLFYLIHFIQATGQISRVYAEFITASFFTKTPTIVMIIAMLLLTASATRTGVETIARISQVFFPILFLSIFIIFVVLIPKIELTNIFPILENGLLPSLKGAIIPQARFSEIFLIIFFIPYLKDAETGLKWGLYTIWLILITFILVNFTILFILGQSMTYATYPFLQASRFVNIGNFIENIDAIIMAVWILGMFTKITVYYFVSLLAIKDLFNLSNYKLMIWPIALLALEFSFWTLPNSMAINQFEIMGLPFLNFSMHTFIPLLIYGIAKIRRF